MNNQTTNIPITLLRNKLAKLAIRLQQQALPGGTNQDFATLESVVAESTKILSQFYKQLAEPSYKPVQIRPNSIPYPALYNANFQSILDDLLVIFAEFENMEGVVVGEFNYMVSRLNKLDRKLKGISSQVSDYILFSDYPSRDALFFSDSFNNIQRVEINSPLLNADQCEVNQVEGIVTLPVNRAAQIAINIIEVPVINSNSNGIAGNNEESGAELHGTISDILDNNADTWFEYERVLSQDDGLPLILDITINLGLPRIINFVRVNPNNFGTRTQVQIESIDTSIDGKAFVSIKDDIPITGFVAEDEENVFTLASSTSKFAGQGLYSFTPREAKYVHLSFKQLSPYIIKTSSGIEKVRYAIGIRDVDIQAIPYLTKGELISTSYEAQDDIVKVALQSSQRPDASTVSSLVSIDHFVSPDNGLTWCAIRPKVSSGVANVDQTIPEILNFNNIDEDTINTNAAVQSLRYKAVFARNTDAFQSDSSELAQEIADNTELHQIPTTTPFSLKLQNTPIDNSLLLVDPQFGSRGKEDVKYQIATGKGSKLSILLPFKPIKRDLQKVANGNFWDLLDKDPEQVYIDEELWARGTLTSTNKHYKLNYEEGRLEFGDGTNGKVVGLGAVIALTFSEEQLLPSRGTDHTVELDYATSNDQNQMEIYILDPPASDTALLKKGAKRHQLQADIISTGSPYTITFSDTNAFSDSKPFVDGNSELIDSGDYSIDYTNGVLYSYNYTSSAQDSFVTYFYNPRTQLDNSQWTFQGSENGLASKISIYDSGYKTFVADTYTIPANTRYFNLPHFAIVQGTAVFSDTATFATEVEFIDGNSELLNVVRVKEELASITGSPTAQWIPFKMKVSTYPYLSVSFDNQSVFKYEKSSELDVDNGLTGSYYIDRSHSTTGGIYVKSTDSVAKPGNVTYYYTNTQTTSTGKYSINYKTGEVFTSNGTTSSTVDYEYTNYRARYDIARLVSPDDWEYTKQDNNIVIKDREILRNTRTPQHTVQSGTGISKFYQVSYRYVKSTRPNISQLEPYFSPVLKDYALKIITKSRMV